MLHPLLARAVVQALRAVFVEQRYADKVIEYTLRQNPKAGARDRSFIAETTYEVVRHFRLYATVLGRTPETDLDFWQIVGIHLILQPSALTGATLPAWQEFSDLNPERIREKATQFQKERKYRESIPDWLDAIGSAELGSGWDKTLAWLNRPADVVLRTNRLKTDRNNLQKALAAEGIETSLLGDEDALVLTRRKNVFRTKAFKAGLFEVQDYSSQQVASFLNPQPGMRVIDACAGGGGKSLHLAALMEGRGQLIALDTLKWKLDELRQRARRAGISNIETRPIENSKVIKRLHNTADALLLDVPCSGLGVLRRNPDSKWKLQPAFIEQLRQTQQEILQSYSKMLKPGGYMVYATCSILPSENNQQIDAFLQSEAGQDFVFVRDRKILPQDEGYDGFYMALLQKKD
ncbi:MAG: RsmB/NOP family class I SAM-dependent RNA methyltransferase [Bacteroidetes bacterium]|nr:MAG: RsmB/NOP family class I SAM-dependent RNA methyltransferase [Bacteroidota bacterium]